MSYQQQGGRGGDRGGNPRGGRGGHGGDRGRGRGGPGGGPPRGGYGGGGPPQRGGQAFRGRGGAPPPNPGPAPALDPHLLDQSLASLVSSFRSMTVDSEDMPLRPGWGTEGQPITLFANFFALRFPKNFRIFDYEVSVTPDDLRGPRKARLFELLERSTECAPHMGFAAHDRAKRLVSTRQLPQPLRVAITYTDGDGASAPAKGPRTYTVDISFKRALEMNAMTPHLEGQDRHYDTAPTISALNLLAQKYAIQSGGIRIGRLENDDDDAGSERKKPKNKTRGNKIFFPSDRSTECHPLTLGLEARRGYFMSVRPLYKQLALNIDTSMAAFYVPGNLAQAMSTFLGQVGSLPERFFNEVRVGTTHLGYPKKHKIFRISNLTARKATFKCDEMGGKTVSVEQFFKEKYRITLRHADDLPVVDCRKTNKDKPIFLPAELCEIVPGQIFKGKLSADATRIMIQVACKHPQENKRFIEDEGMRLLGLSSPSGTLSQLGISVCPTMIGVPARVLSAPRITYKSGAPRINDASWNIVDVKFHTPAALTQWTVLLVQEGRSGEFSGPNDPDLSAFLATFQQKCRNSGMAVSAPSAVLATTRLPSPRSDPGRRQALNIIQNTIKQSNKPKLIIVLLSGEDDFIYPGIKQLCDMKMGVLTVNMLLTPRKARVPDRNKLDQYFSNVALKVNAKLGGINHLLSDDKALRWLKQKKTMLVGIDVTHPSPVSLKGTPSLVAVVASVDDNFVQFPASLGLQRNRNINKDAEEMIQELTSLLVERLTAYQKKLGQLPDRILVFRDGVSEGQYDLVLNKEKPRIQAAFAKFATASRGKAYNPSLSIIVCGKRHNARFPATAVSPVTRNGNTVPGTVVDKGVTDIYDHDFYLQAHNGLQGTVKPTHYTVVYDQNKMDADTVQLLTHNLSYLYARATKGVSLVPPAYYADLACERARIYLNTIMNLGDDATSTVSSQNTRRSQEEEREYVYSKAVQQWGQGVHPEIRNSMFYI